MNIFAKVFIVLSLSLLLFTGCASTGAQSVDANYAAYVAAVQAYSNVEHKPMVDLELTEDGKVKGIKVWKERPPLNIAQKKDPAPHPGWKVLNSVVRVGGIIGGIWAAGEAMEGLVEAIPAGGNHTNIGSYNGADGSATISDSWNSSTFRDVTGDTQIYPFEDSSVDNTDNSTDNSATDDNSVTN
jgi:hypothetical protein